MELNRISEFPFISKDLEVKVWMFYIAYLKILLRDEEEEFEKYIAQLQNQCKHEFKKIMIPAPKDHLNQFGEEIMKGEECTQCGFFKPRPEGSPYEVCYKCGGKMNYEVKEPGQGGDGRHHYKCTICKHPYTDT